MLDRFNRKMDAAIDAIAPWALPLVIAYLLTL